MQLSDYFFGINLFNGIDQQTLPAREFWENWAVGNTERVALREFALIVLSIAPHSAATERVFSSLGLSKTDMRSRISSETLKEIGMVKSALKQEMKTLSRAERSSREETWRSGGIGDELVEVMDSLTIGSGAPFTVPDPQNEQDRDVFLPFWPHIDAEEEEVEVEVGFTSIFQSVSGDRGTLEKFLDLNQLRTANDVSATAAEPHIFSTEDDGESFDVGAVIAGVRART